MSTDMSTILPCPNCKSKPRVTGISAGNPVKIRCSNKKCELSRESAGVQFWQGVRRDFSQDETRQAFDQFSISLKEKDDKIKAMTPIVDGALWVLDHVRSWQNDAISSFSIDVRSLILAVREYKR